MKTRSVSRIVDDIQQNYRFQGATLKEIRWCLSKLDGLCRWHDFDGSDWSQWKWLKSDLEWGSFTRMYANRLANAQEQYRQLVVEVRAAEELALKRKNARDARRRREQ